MEAKNKGKIIIFLSTGVLTLGIISSNIKIGYGYTKNHKDFRNENLSDTTITEIIYNTTQEVNKGPMKSSGKVAYITIDDGPSKYTDRIIEILDKYNAKGTFFMIDRNMKSYPEQVKNIVESGNTAGFHSVSHDIHKLYKKNISAKEEFDINRKTFYDITGQESSLVRLPYGSKPYTPSESYKALVDANYKVWDWNVDTEDWKSDSNKILENVKMYSKNEDDIVVLIHEKKQTVESLDKVLKYLSEQGYELLPISQSQDPKNFWIGNLYK
ncbi:polysaccharide deacetylase family protein [Faecalimicrobium dakarense]|uniref:polysaccharide deacetylase family protein n=1 Tax=Faecalimicrobium dakarense TaxID=1301100 RepID=UPI0004B8AC21|nr:polysaccharide deacetylase family protein [[Clostridium] dakarense]